MFAITFVGHQGWLFQTARACLLVDPLLRPSFGEAHALGYNVYPPRVLKPEAFPRIDALILSHEHDDHFDIPSLAQLDRSIPVFLSARSSAAGHRILCEMGFTVQPLMPGVTLRIEDLEFLPLCGDHVNNNTEDEWDTLPFLVYQTEGDGSFFSTVDVTLGTGLIEMARARVPEPGIIGWTNNALDWSHMSNYLPERGDATAGAIQRMRAGHQLYSGLWGPPRGMLICAGGFSFQGDRAWMNRRVFCVDTERVAKGMAALVPDQQFHAARPGQTFVMKGNRIVQVDRQTPFLGMTPPNTWPLRTRDLNKPVVDYAPATGRRELTEDEEVELRHRLAGLAEALVGTTLFKGLHSLLMTETPGRSPTFALVLREGADRRRVFSYNPNACNFDEVEAAQPRDVFLAGMECWASDMLAVLSGELGPIALNFGRAYLWNALPERFNFSLFTELYRVSHPLSRPAAVLRTYERIWQESAAIKPVIRGRAEAASDPG